MTTDYSDFERWAEDRLQQVAREMLQSGLSWDESEILVWFAREVPGAPARLYEKVLESLRPPDEARRPYPPPPTPAEPR